MLRLPILLWIQIDEEEELVTAGTNAAETLNDAVSPPAADAETSIGPN